MRKFLITLSILFISGCSIDGLIVWGEVNKVQIVKQNAYIKHYRAYFHRSPLHTIRHGKKYLFFYNRKTKDLAILLHPKNKYILYSFSHPDLVMKIRSDRKHSYAHMMKTLRQKGYRITSPHTVGYTTNVSLRRYKKVKTYLVEVKNYQHLQHLYKKAIKTYNAKGIKKIKTKLPKVLIDTYYQAYKAKATTTEQFKALNIIANKLDLETFHPSKKQTSQEKSRAETLIDTKKDNSTQLYRYYLKDASYTELTHYLSSSDAKHALSYEQHNMLNKRYNQMKEERLLENGSLEELISAYKKNKNPKYKLKIMQRIKEIDQMKKT